MSIDEAIDRLAGEVAARLERIADIAEAHDTLHVRHWRTVAACRDIDTEVFFPSGEGETARALRFCATCPVQSQCLEDALESMNSYQDIGGIWAGTNHHDRRAMRLRRGKVAV